MNSTPHDSRGTLSHRVSEVNVLISTREALCINIMCYSSKYGQTWKTWSFHSLHTMVSRLRFSGSSVKCLRPNSTIRPTKNFTLAKETHNQICLYCEALIDPATGLWRRNRQDSWSNFNLCVTGNAWGPLRPTHVLRTIVISCFNY